MQRSLFLGCSLVLLSACSLLGGTTEGTSSQSSSEAAAPETHNVSYTGTVEESGSRYLLRLHDGRSVELSSDYLSLDEYIGLDIVAFGSVRPLPNDAGVALRVESVTLLSAATSSSLSSSPESGASEDAKQPSSLSSAVAPPVVSSKAQAPASSLASVPPPSAPAVSSKPTAASVPGLSAAMEAKVQAMAKEDIAAGRWTQQYCSSHIGFCVAVHKNWWFTSFGTAASALWHVEVSNGEIAGLGDGPLAVNLMTGSVEAAGASDGAIVEKDGFVLAYRAWKDNTHFVVRAPVALKEAVRYMALSISSYAPAQ